MKLSVVPSELRDVVLACLLGSGAATPVCVSVESNLTAPVLLAYSGAEQLLEAGDFVAVNFSGPETVWIVPSGEAWDPQRGCPGCFHLSVKALATGEPCAVPSVAVARMGPVKCSLRREGLQGITHLSFKYHKG